jgi:hypothetical protein
MQQPIQKVKQPQIINTTVEHPSAAQQWRVLSEDADQLLVLRHAACFS